MICRAAAREACLMIPPSSPAFLAEQQSIFAQTEIQSELESIQCCRIYITGRHPPGVAARGVWQFSSTATREAAEGQPVLRCGRLALVKPELCLCQKKNPSLLQPFPSERLEQCRGRMSSGCCHLQQECPSLRAMLAPKAQPGAPHRDPLLTPSIASLRHTSISVCNIQGNTTGDHKPCQSP